MLKYILSIPRGHFAQVFEQNIDKYEINQRLELIIYRRYLFPPEMCYLSVQPTVINLTQGRV